VPAGDTREVRPMVIGLLVPTVVPALLDVDGTLA
jgi:hypothetical protein